MMVFLAPTGALGVTISVCQSRTVSFLSLLFVGQSEPKTLRLVEIYLTSCTRLHLLVSPGRLYRATGRQVRPPETGSDLLRALHPQLPQQALRQLPRPPSWQTSQRGVHILPLLSI